MKISVFGLTLMSAGAVAALKTTASEAGHEIVQGAESAVSVLWAKVKAEEPDFVAAANTAIADATTPGETGFQKLEHVVLDLLPKAPALIAELPNLKDFVVHGVTELFASGVTALENAAEAALKAA